MEGLVTGPVVSLTAIRRVKLFPGGRYLSRELDALAWDPTAVRAILDRKIYRHPTIAVLAPIMRDTERGNGG
jgi:hypothetical protein